MDASYIPMRVQMGVFEQYDRPNPETITIRRVGVNLPLYDSATGELVAVIGEDWSPVTWAWEAQHEAE